MIKEDEKNQLMIIKKNKLNIVISIHDSVKKNINAFKLIIYVQEDFQFLLIKMNAYK